MNETASKDEELVEAVKKLFRERCGEFRIKEFVKVARLLGLEVWEKRTSENFMKMSARKHSPEVFATNIDYALEEFEWKDFYPITDDDITVTGLWDPLKMPEKPAGYVMDESGRYLKLAGL